MLRDDVSSTTTDYSESVLAEQEFEISGDLRVFSDAFCKNEMDLHVSSSSGNKITY